MNMPTLFDVGMTTLVALPHMHDLPPKWDGLSVKWRPWSEARTSLAFHLPDAELACEKCGLIDERLVTVGVCEVPEGAVVVEQVVRRTKRNGHEYLRAVESPARPYMRLFAYRCRGCQHDVVQDEETGQRWDLDSSDYSANGSVAP